MSASDDCPDCVEAHRRTAVLAAAGGFVGGLLILSAVLAVTDGRVF
jgi:hypothetical protein